MRQIEMFPAGKKRTDFVCAMLPTGGSVMIDANAMKRGAVRAAYRRYCKPGRGLSKKTMASAKQQRLHEFVRLCELAVPLFDLNMEAEFAFYEQEWCALFARHDEVAGAGRSEALKQL